MEEKFGSHTTSCLPSCPTGYLPWAASLVLLNSNIFSREEASKWFSTAQTPNWTKFASEKTPAIAIGFSNEPLFQISELPYQIKSGVPYYAGKSVTVQCIPCEYNCDGFCNTGSLWVLDLKKCFVGEFCPGEYIKIFNPVSERLECVLPTQGVLAISSIEMFTLDLATGV